MQQITRSFCRPKTIPLLLGAFVFCIQCSSTNPVDVQNADRIAHESRINEDETWSSKQEHIITDDVLVENATLTIQAGSVVKFQPGTSLKIQNGGILIARGSAKDSIRFTNAKTDSAWARIEIDSNADVCQLAYCTIENGGFGSDSLSAMISCRKGLVSMTNCAVRNSQTNGLRILKGANLAEFSKNKFRGNEMAPVTLPVSKVAALAPDNSFAGNGNDVIHIQDSDPITENAKWSALDVPYQFAVDLTINESELELAPGVKLKFESFTKLEIGYKGGLQAKGTADSTIEFSGVEPQPGFWQGVFLKEGSRVQRNQFANCVFSGGGSTPFQYADGIAFSANFFGEAGEPEFINCRFENSLGYGVIFTKYCTPAQFKQNTVWLNRGPAMRVCPEALNQLRDNRIYDNTGNFIEVSAGNITRESTIWNNLVPYRIVGEINIYYGTVSIEAGTSFELDSQAGVAISAGGGLMADGISPGSMITFSGVFKQPGSWKFIHFGRDCNESACKLNYCQLQYGGGDLRWPAIIYLEGVSPEITNCQISFSKHWGIFKSNNAAPNLTNTIFYSNFDGDVWP